MLEDWQAQLDRTQPCSGRALGKLVTVKMKLVPQHGGKGWLLDGEAYDAGAVRGADADLVEAMETLLRELQN